jgi:hypothetical protein
MVIGGIYTQSILNTMMKKLSCLFLLSWLAFSCQLQQDEASEELLSAQRTTSGEYFISYANGDPYTVTITIERAGAPEIHQILMKLYTCDGLADLTVANIVGVTINGTDWSDASKLTDQVDLTDFCYGTFNDPIIKLTGFDDLEPEVGENEIQVYTIVLTLDEKTSGGSLLIGAGEAFCYGNDPENGFDVNYSFYFECTDDGGGDDGGGDDGGGDDGGGDDGGGDDGGGDNGGGDDGGGDDNGDVCYEYKGETAWAFGPRYTSQGNWATYTPYPGGTIEVDIFAGQHHKAGKAKIEPNGDNEVTITITLNEGWSLKGSESVKIQTYYGSTGPSGNPAPGQFKYKSDSLDPITLPRADFYGIHLDVQLKKEVPCTCDK